MRMLENIYNFNAFWTMIEKKPKQGVSIVRDFAVIRFLEIG